MNQKCQRKRDEEASLLANAVDNQPRSSHTISKAPATTEAAPAEAAPATTDVSVPVPEQPKKLVGRLVFP